MHTVSLKVEGLSCAYGAKTVLEDVTLSFEPGKLYGILGPNGSGKTTLLRHLCGLQKPQSGTVLLDGETALSAIPRKALAKRISLLPQHRLFPDISVEDFVGCGRFPHLGFSQKLSPTDLAVIRNAMEKAGVLSLAHRRLPTLSGGERQRVFLAMLLSQDTDIVLLDEPTTYLDIRHKFEMTDLCRALCREGKTVITVLHDLPLALSVCDRIVLLNGGRCTAPDTPAAFFESGTLDRAFGIRLHREEINGETVYAQLPVRQTEEHL